MASTSLEVNKFCLCIAEKDHFIYFNGGKILRQELKSLLRQKYELIAPILDPAKKEDPVKKPKRKKIVKASPKFAMDKNDFYMSWEWRTLRMDVLNHYGRACMSCGETNGKICVDHVKSLHTHWELRLEIENLQVLCDACNMGKGAQDYDFRKRSPGNDVKPAKGIK